jgi:hypothetical protein
MNPKAGSRFEILGSALLTAKTGSFHLEQLEFQALWQPHHEALTPPKHTQRILTLCRKVRVMPALQDGSSFASFELRVHHLWSALNPSIYI